MYKVCYYPTQSETVLFFKWFKTLQEATFFAGNKPNESVIEIKYYDNTEHRKPNRN
jgi:hypothetical protein